MISLTGVDWIAGDRAYAAGGPASPARQSASTAARLCARCS